METRVKKWLLFGGKGAYPTDYEQKNFKGFYPSEAACERARLRLGEKLDWACFVPPMTDEEWAELAPKIGFGS